MPKLSWKRFVPAGYLFLIAGVPHVFAATTKPLNIPIIVQEAIYPGAATQGISRDHDPLTVGIPLADWQGVSDSSQLGLTGASVGQFRVLGRWPSGNIKWLLIDTQANLSAGKTSHDIALTNGHGNFGGPDLARDQGQTILVNTGPAEFVIRKAKFNVFDSVTVNGKTIVAPGSSVGLVLMGPRADVSVEAPPAPQVSASPGEKVYSVRVSYETISGETEASPKVVVRGAPGGRFTVASPPKVTNATGYYVYAGDAGDPEFLQTPTPMPLGTNWTVPNGPLATSTWRFPAISGVGTGCGVCDVAYSSTNDSGSMATIEENGPARTVIRASGSHVDTAGHAYMHYTVRMHFYKGKTYAKVEVILRNADNVRSQAGEFNSAYKGFASYEIRLTSSLTGSPKFDIGTDKSSATGLLAENDTAYLYQGYSDDGEIADWKAYDCRAPGDNRCVASYIRRSVVKPGEYAYAQDGFQVVHGNQVVSSGNHSRYPQGWADLADNSGAGVEIGVYQLSGYWPKSLQFDHDGREITVGIWPNQKLFQGGGGQPYYQAWPAYSVHDLYFNFHSSALASPANDFLKFQHFLLARAPREQYNDSSVLFYALPYPRAEDNLYSSLRAGCCLTDRPPKIFRFYSWPEGGAGNQHELRLSYLRNWLQRGQPGRFIFAANFYRMVVERSFPRSDGFNWRDHSTGQFDGPTFLEEVQSANGAMALRDWMDTQHAHWYGMTTYYFLTGDETVKDQLLDGVKDRFVDLRSKLNNGRLYDTRDVGEHLMGLASLYDALRAMGDPDTPAIVQAAKQTLNTLVFPELNLSGFGVGKPIPGLEGSHGISRTRGVQYGCCTRDTMPGFSGRVAGPFHQAILAEGMWELAQVFGPTWPDYTLLNDLMYGVAEWSLKEAWAAPPGQHPNAQNAGFIYEIFLDQPNAGLKYFQNPGAGQTKWVTFFVPAAYAGDMSWQKDFEGFIRRVSQNSTRWAEYGSHMVQAVVNQVLNPPDWQLVTVPLNVTSHGGGSYTLSWTVPQGARHYRVKYNADGKEIVDWLDFDARIGTFGVNPNKNWPWFACEEASNVPAPAAPGSTQTYTFKGDPSKIYKFALKAIVARH